MMIRLAPRSEGKARAQLRQQSGTTHSSHNPAACSFPGANARSWAGRGEARPGQSSLSAYSGLFLKSLKWLIRVVYA